MVDTVAEKEMNVSSAKLFGIDREKMLEFRAMVRDADPRPMVKLAPEYGSFRVSSEVYDEFIGWLRSLPKEKTIMDWPTLEKTITSWCIQSQDASDLIFHLHRIFGENPDSPAKAKEWLSKYQPPLHGAPDDLVHGRLKDVPQEIGLPRVIRYLKHGRDAP